MSASLRRLAAVTPALLALVGARPADDVVKATPASKVQTDPVPSEGNSADDPAIWIHPDDPDRSLVLGTDKKGGLHSYSLDGRDHQMVSPGSQPNNVDILYGFRLADRTTDLAAASVGKGGASEVKIWTIEPANGTLAEIGDGPTFRVFDGGDPYGLCTYRSPVDGAAFIFVTDRDGAVEQYRLNPGADRTRAIRATASAASASDRKPRGSSPTGSGPGFTWRRRRSESGSTGPSRATAPIVGPWRASASTG